MTPYDREADEVIGSFPKTESRSLKTQDRVGFSPDGVRVRVRVRVREKETKPTRRAARRVSVAQRWGGVRRRGEARGSCFAVRLKTTFRLM